MSYDPRKPDAPSGASGGYIDTAEQSRQGSVRAARERLRAAQSQQGTDPLNSQTQRQLPQSQYLAPNTPGRPQPDQIPQRNDQNSRYDEGQNNQRPPQPQQWPLPVNSPASARNAPPPRPARGPSAPPLPAAFYDNSRAAPPPGGLQSPPAGYWQDDEYLSPTYGNSPVLGQGRPLTNSSMASDSSSVGSIPDFPVPSTQLPAIRRPQIIGPPPSARRGPSSYYSQFSYVSPIYEEAERASVNSYASSNVMPSTMPDFYLEDGEGETPSDEEDEATGGLNRRPSTDHNDQSNLVRKASLGKRTKPTLTTIRSAESFRADGSSMPRPPMPALQSPPQIITPKASKSRLGRESVLFDDSSPESEEISLNFPESRSKEFLSTEDAPSPISSPTTRGAPRSTVNPRDPRVDKIFGGLERGGALDPATAKEIRQSTRGTLADRVGAKRPPSLNVGAVREAEARGSMTSLPDLIRRATRLAANLDRGKTASRLGWDWINNGEYEKQRDPKDRKSAGGLSGILSAFPPPGATPTTERTRWPTNNYPSNTGSDRSLNPYGKYKGRNPPANTRRRCCGMSLRTFLLVAFILLLLIAAAVVLPVVLIVLPNQRAATSTANNGAAANAMCQTKSPCSNGGSSVLQPDGSCACLCTNGYTGAQCTIPGDGGCTTVSTSTVKAASVGNQLPPLFQVAAKNYSIPLDQSRLLALFSSANMSCNIENALVTLTGASSTKRSNVESFLDGLTPAGRKERRASPASNTDGVVVASVKATPTLTSAASSTSPIVIATGSSAPGTNATSKDFAKIGILFVLQESKQLEVAVQAQTALSNYMSSAVSQGSSMVLAHNVTLGNGYFIDLWYWTVTLANGTVYGNGFNGTASSAPLVTTTPAAG